MLFNTAIKALGLLAAVVAIASAAIDKGKKPGDALIPRDVKTFSYRDSFVEHELDVGDACKYFKSACSRAARHDYTDASIVVDCTNDRTAKTIDASCVQAACNRTLTGYTGRILATDDFRGPALFRKPIKCDKEICQCNDSICGLDPDEITDKDLEPKHLGNGTYTDSCPYPPEVGYFI